MKAIYLWSACWCDKDITDAIDIARTIVVYDVEQYTVAPKYIDSLRNKNRAFPTSSSSFIPKSAKIQTYNSFSREKIIIKVVNDFRLFQLYSRFNRFDMISHFSFTCKCNDAVDYALEFLDTYKVTEILCIYTPHTFESFIFIKTLEICGVSVQRLSASPLPWVVYSLSGLENTSPDQFKKTGILDIDAANSRVRMYFKLLNSNYKNAIPWYEKKTPFSIKSLLFGIPSFFNIKNIVKWVLTQRVRKEISSYTRGISNERPYGVYFLHLQPEANTMPEAGIYYDQYQAIKKLSDAMPSDVTLLVKEHPSIFSRECDIRYRPKGFYTRLCKIRNVKICPIDSSVFSLIDNAKFVASVSGMCMTEALARSIPVVSFNPARFKNFPLDAVIDGCTASLVSLSERLSKIVNKSYIFPEDEVFSSFVKLESFGYVSALGENAVPNTRIEQLNMSLNAAKKAVIDF